MLNFNPITLFIVCSLTASSLHALNIEAFKAMYDEIKTSGEMTLLMENLDTAEFTNQLNTMEVMDMINPRNSGEMTYLFSDSNSFTFSTLYNIREASGLTGVTYAEIRVFIEQHIPETTLLTEQLLKQAKNMAILTCDKIDEDFDGPVHWQSEESTPNNIIGDYTKTHAKEKKFLQKFYEQQTQDVIMKLDGVDTKFTLTVNVVEKVDEILLNSLDKIAESNNFQMTMKNKLEILRQIVATGVSLFNKKMVPGYMILNNMGYVLIKHRGGSISMEVRLLFSDNTVSIDDLTKDSNGLLIENYERYEDLYKAPWYKKDEDNKFKSTKEMKEVGFAMLVIMNKFIKLNGMSDDPNVVSILASIESKFPKEQYNTPENVPDCMEISNIVEVILTRGILI